jgi:hypothetical protein
MEVQNVADEAFVKFSVQGSSFMLPRAAVEAIDWMPRNMINSPLKGDLVNDVHYLNCDAQSFRMLYQIGKGDQDVSDLSHLTSLEISLLKNTAQYLAMNELLPALEHIRSSKVEPLNKENEDALKLYAAVKRAVERRHIAAWRCQHTRPHVKTPCKNKAFTFSIIKDEVYPMCNMCDRECRTFMPYPRNNEYLLSAHSSIHHFTRVDDVTAFIVDNI